MYKLHFTIFRHIALVPFVHTEKRYVYPKQGPKGEINYIITPAYCTVPFDIFIYSIYTIHSFLWGHNPAASFVS